MVRSCIKFGTGIALAMMAVSPAMSSSHREAPNITKMPKVDNTDVYAFRSYEPGRAGFTTLISNFQPLQDPGGGPNYFTMDPDALYEIMIDSNGGSRGSHISVPILECAAKWPRHYDQRGRQAIADRAARYRSDQHRERS